VVAERIVSLLPSATEILFALGVGDRVVGVTYECTVPAEAASRPHVTDTIIDPGATPAEIDATIKNAVATGRELYTLDRELLASLEPDLLVTQDLCRVCALPAGSAAQALVELGLDCQVHHFDPKTLDGVLSGIDELAALVGSSVDLTGTLRERITAVEVNTTGTSRPRVLLLEWTDPPFGPGHWIPDQIRLAGGEPVLAHPGDRSAETTWETVANCGADVLLVAPCGFDQTEAERQLAEVMARPELAELPAVVHGRGHGLDADALIVRPGPRLIDGVEAIAELLHARS